MYDLDKAYSKKFFARRKSLAWRIPIVCDAIIDVLKPKSVIDVGCGNGDLVRGFRDRDISSYGIEGTYNCIQGYLYDPENLYIFQEDLRIPNRLERYSKTDLAICFEVAEHIEPEYTDIFLDNLCSVSDKILFSAAGPGQGGLHHHNCQSKDYWITKFEQRSYLPKNLIVKQLHLYWTKWKNKKGIKAYYQNLMYFEYEEPII